MMHGKTALKFIELPCLVIGSIGGNVIQLVSQSFQLQHFYINTKYTIFLVLFSTYCDNAAMASSFSRFLDHTQRRTTVGRTPLDDCSVRRRE